MNPQRRFGMIVCVIVQEHRNGQNKSDGRGEHVFVGQNWHIQKARCTEKRHRRTYWQYVQNVIELVFVINFHLTLSTILHVSQPSKMLLFKQSARIFIMLFKYNNHTSSALWAHHCVVVTKHALSIYTNDPNNWNWNSISNPSAPNWRFHFLYFACLFWQELFLHILLLYIPTYFYQPFVIVAHHIFIDAQNEKACAPNQIQCTMLLTKNN